MDRHYFAVVVATWALAFAPLFIARALKRAGVSAELIGGALFVFTRRRVVAVGVRGVEVAFKSSVRRMSDIDIMAANVAGRF